jgi:pimeloyl-ACP methyl ester carboxylesterase
MTAGSASSTLATWRGRRILLLLCAVAFLDFVDASITNVALPHIRTALHFSAQDLQWVPSAYLLTYGGFMLLGGRLADVIGTSQAKGAEFLGRFLRRSDDRDPASDLAVRDAQHQAIRDWGTPGHDALQRLAGIRCPALILHGDNDRVIPARASHLMAGLIPDARITIYPDSAHAFLFQYPGEVAAQISTFLS